MITNVGFTGTKLGMRELQRERVSELLEVQTATCSSFHHGDCVGSDAEADEIARAMGYGVHLHVPISPQFRAFCPVRVGFDIVYRAKPYLERNQDIVDSSHLLIGTPKEMTEALRSGTWSTIRYARRLRRPIHVVWPDGSVTNENMQPRMNF